MENRQLLIQKKQELVALETKLQQLPKPSSSGTIGMVITLIGIPTMLVGLSGAGELLAFGFLLVLIGTILWVSGSLSKSKRKKAIEETNAEILKVKNAIIEVEHS